MTEIDVAKLRSLAEQAKNRPDSVEWQRFWDELTEDHILALLDRLEQAEAAIERAKSKHRKMTDDDEPYCLACYQSPYGHAPWPCLTVAALDTGKEKNDGN